MKVKLIGNSHLGTIAPELTRVKGSRDVQHFISRTYGTTPAVLVGSTESVELTYIKLDGATKYGQTVDLQDCDIAVTVGLNFSLVQLVKLWERFVPVGASGSYDAQSLSDEVWDAHVDAVFDSTFMVRTLNRLQLLDAPAVAVIPQPAPADWVSAREGGRFEIYRRLRENGDWDRVRSDFSRQIRRLEQRGIKVFSQPSTTLTEDGFTRDRFAMGNPSDEAPDSFYARGDFYHMNREFARLVVPEFYGWLDKVSGAPSNAPVESTL